MCACGRLPSKHWTALNQWLTARTLGFIPSVLRIYHLSKSAAMSAVEATTTAYKVAAAQHLTTTYNRRQQTQNAERTGQQLKGNPGVEAAKPQPTRHHAGGGAVRPAHRQAGASVRTYGRKPLRAHPREKALPQWPGTPKEGRRIKDPYPERFRLHSARKLQNKSCPTRQSKISICFAGHPSTASRACRKRPHSHDSRIPRPAPSSIHCFGIKGVEGVLESPLPTPCGIGPDLE